MILCVAWCCYSCDGLAGLTEAKQRNFCALLTEDPVPEEALGAGQMSKKQPSFVISQRWMKERAPQGILGSDTA